MSQHETRREIPTSVRWNHAKPISRGESECVSESEGSEQGTGARVKAGRFSDVAGEDEGVKRKEQAIRRAAGDRTRGEGVAIFH